MPPKKKQRLCRPKRGRGHDGRGSCGRGHGGWLGRRVDLLETEGAPEQLEQGNDDNPICTNETVKSEQFDDSYENLQLAPDETLTLQEHGNKTVPTVSPHAPEMPFSIKEENVATTTVQTSQMENSPLFGEDGKMASCPTVISQDTVARAKAKISELLPQHWTCMIFSYGFNLLLLSRDKFMTTQRCIYISFSGEMSLSVHRIDLPEVRTKELVKSLVTVPFREDTLDEFVTQVMNIVKEVRAYEICSGCDHKEYEHLWAVDKKGVVDFNTFGETRYTKTYRSLDCKLLVKPSKWRCMACYLLTETLRKKLTTHSKEMQLKTPNIYLTDEEKLAKLSKLQADLKLKNRQIDRLTLMLKSPERCAPLQSCE